MVHSKQRIKGYLASGIKYGMNPNVKSMFDNALFSCIVKVTCTVYFMTRLFSPSSYINTPLNLYLLISTLRKLNF